MKKEIKIFDIKINPFTKKEFLSVIETEIKNGGKIIQNGINAASVNELVTNPDLLNAYQHSDLINIDGMSIVWALRFLGYTVPERVACPDLANDIMRIAEKNSYKLFLFGASEKSLGMSLQNLQHRFPKLEIVGFRNGYYKLADEDAIVNLINSANPDILFIGLPSPAKELFMEKYKSSLNVKYTLGVGGYFDILAGKTKRAPEWMQYRGLEWFYRFIQEPKRMWRRYMVGNFKFVQLILKEKFKQKKSARRYKLL